MNIHRVYGIFLPRFRRKRMERFRKTFAPIHGTRILDVGGDPYNWSLTDCPGRITLLNLRAPWKPEPRFDFVKANALTLPFRDASFDIVYSNSVIEHVGDLRAQRRFAEETQRVGRHLWIQTPDRRFWMEPHLITPFIHYLSPATQIRMIRYCTVWGVLTCPSKESVKAFVKGTHLLDRNDLSEIFSDCTIVEERFLGASKSLLVIR